MIALSARCSMLSLLARLANNIGMFNTAEKKERSLGIRLLLKPERCASPKCAMVRNANRPGLHGKSHRRAMSEFGQQLQEKQKIKYTYGVREAYLQKIFSWASKNPGVTGEMMISLLERRLDNVVYRLGIAPSRSVGRQMVSHGHIVVNNHRVMIPSYQVSVGDVIHIRIQSMTSPLFKDVAEKIKKVTSPIWLSFGTERMEGAVVSLPKDCDIPFDVNMVVDYYSK